MIATLDSADSYDRTTTVLNILSHVRSYRECLVVLQKALHSVDKRVRLLATQALLRQNKELQWPDIDNLEAFVAVNELDFAS
jgi:hypothetical protein